MTRPLFTLLAALLMTACSAGEAHAAPAPDADPWGNVYPPQCRDLSGISLPVIEVGHLPVTKGSGDRCGAWLPRPRGNIIYVLETCTVDGRRISRAEVLRHEICHERMFHMTGDPRWHP